MATNPRNSEDSTQEDEALLAQNRQQQKRSRWSRWKDIGLFTWAFLATMLVIVLAVTLQHKQSLNNSKDAGELRPLKPKGKRNLIFMVSDGMGPTSLSLTRSYRQNVLGLPIADTLHLDRHLIGSSRTRSSSSLVTDSAAGATAFSCGMKSYNGAISILPDHSPCGTILEAAKRAGYMTGLVVTTRLTDATPACFASHVNVREEEDSIARQMIGDHPLGRVVDLMMGGGRCHFLSKSSSGSCRADDLDVVEMARKNNFTYIYDRHGFDNLQGGNDVDLPLLGLFAPTDIPYEIDRRNMTDIYPSLDEMANAALTALSIATEDSDQGFFLMIEGSRIDHAGHGNDPAAQVHEVLAYDKAFESVLQFLAKDETQGIVVSTSDHETGGLATARQLHASYPEYLWYPEVLGRARHSGEHLARKLSQFRQGKVTRSEIRKYTTELVRDGLGIDDVSQDELDAILTRENDNELHWAYAFADLISRRAQTGWSTHGHSAVDVNIYSSDPRYAAALVGNHENTEVGNFLRDYLELDLEPITKELKAAMHTFEFDGGSVEVSSDDVSRKSSWTGRLPDEHRHLNSEDHYSGDFRKRQECGCLVE